MSEGIQTSYDFTTRAAIEGLQANLSLNDVQAKIAEDIVPFGRAVVRGSTDNAVKLPEADDELFVGISLLRYGAENPLVAPGIDPSSLTEYNQFDAMAVLSTGYVWVFTEENVTPGSPVYYRYEASGGNTELGRFRTTEEEDKTLLLEGATFETTTLAGNLALIRLVK